MRTIRHGRDSSLICLNFYPLKGRPRLIGYPDAGFRNNPDGTPQRAYCIFIASERQNGIISSTGSLVDYQSTKITRKTVLSTTVAELYALMKCFGTCLFLRGLWMDITGIPPEILSLIHI